MRGSRLFLEITKEDREKQQPGRKGRSEQLLEQRNEKLFYRYYYYSRLLHYGYEQMLKQLQKEFDLTERSLNLYLSIHAERLKEVNAEKKTVKQLKQMWPHFNWNGQRVEIGAHKG